jgi:uncharacterized membrane protein
MLYCMPHDFGHLFCKKTAFSLEHSLVMFAGTRTSLATMSTLSELVCKRESTTHLSVLANQVCSLLLVAFLARCVYMLSDIVDFR